MNPLDTVVTVDTVAVLLAIMVSATTWLDFRRLRLAPHYLWAAAGALSVASVSAIFGAPEVLPRDDRSSGERRHRRPQHPRPRRTAPNGVFRPLARRAGGRQLMAWTR